MPGLLRGVARTAVIAGTASAVSGRVQRRQASRYAEQDAQTAAARSEAYYAQMQAQAPPPAAPAAPAAPAPAGASLVDQLKDLAELKNQGILTDAEFEAQKAKILAG